LAEKTPIVLAGDDDQALYDFKSASPEHIRERHRDQRPDYASFSLPHCSRSTRVIVEAANDIISMAEEMGFLKERIQKSYQYFEDEEKDKESSQYPRIVYSQKFSKQIPWFIEEQIKKISEDLKRKFTVLIISPTKIQSRDIVKALNKKGFQNIEFVEKKDSKEPTLIDGLKILLKERKDNLGWRIVTKHLLAEYDFISLISETNKQMAKSIIETISKNCKINVTNMVKTLRAIINDKKVNQDELEKILRHTGCDPYKNAKESIKSDILNSSQKLANPGLRKIIIKLTTIQSSKGLVAEYVFITHFNDQYFIRDKNKSKIIDQHICNLLGALTRAKRNLYLISSNFSKEPTFLNWITEKRIDRI
jgi:superfamily I DNA/RNA helicase